MKKAKLLSALSSIVILFVFAAAGTANGRDLLSEMKVPADNGKTIIINTFTGHVKITGGSEKELSVKVYGKTEDKESFNIESAENDNGIKVDCKQKNESAAKDNEGNPELNIEISIPEKENVNVKTGSGNLVVHNVKGKLKLYTVEGNIDTKNISDNIYGVSGKGDISVDNCQGDVNLITSGGNIDVKDFAGSVMAFTDLGFIHLKGANAPVCASTGGGEIILDYIGVNYGMILNSESGDIKLNLPNKFEADLNLLSDNGKISGDLENKNNKNYVIAPLNGGGKKLYCVTNDGNIEFNLKNN